MTQVTTAPLWQVPRINRTDRWVGGVAAAIAREVGVQPMVLRVAFVVLILVGGWGLVLYALAWALLAVVSPEQISPYRPTPKGATSVHRHLGVGLVTLGLLLLFRPFTSNVFDNIVWPVGFVLTGALIAWSRTTREAGGLNAVVRVVAGLVVAVGGILAFTALQYNLVNTVIGVIFGLAILSGITLVAAPSVVRMAHDLDDERLNRIRSDERARISAHLHDSVLQTLSLIQRHSDDPQRTAHLARQQERELRNWLYGAAPSGAGLTRLGTEIERIATEIEEAFDTRIEVVTAGDTEDLAPSRVLDELIAATREAIRNAAAHAESPTIDVFAERSATTLSVFVRDTGIGFDPAIIEESRQGVRESIVARMERAGGKAVIHSVVGEGTEVELELPLRSLQASP